jgi:hypothetical protein
MTPTRSNSSPKKAAERRLKAGKPNVMLKQ